MDAVSWLQIASAFTLNVGFAWLVGSWCARHWMRANGGCFDDFAPSLRRLDLAAAGLTALGSAVGLLVATAIMGDVGLRQACPMFRMMLTSTDYGHTEMITFGCMLLFFAVRWHEGARQAHDIPAFAILVSFAVTRASMGHAGEDGLFTASLAAEAIHYCAVAVLTGAVSHPAGMRSTTPESARGL